MVSNINKVSNIIIPKVLKNIIENIFIPLSVVSSDTFHSKIRT